MESQMVFNPQQHVWRFKEMAVTLIWLRAWCRSGGRCVAWLFFIHLFFFSLIYVGPNYHFSQLVLIWGKIVGHVAVQLAELWRYHLYLVLFLKCWSPRILNSCIFNLHDLKSKYSVSLSPPFFPSLIIPSLSLLNHDCRPNCVMVFEGTKLRLRAVRDISPDEEVWERSHINNI